MLRSSAAVARSGPAFALGYLAGKSARCLLGMYERMIEEHILIVTTRSHVALVVAAVKIVKKPTDTFFRERLIDQLKVWVYPAALNTVVEY